MSNRQYKQYEEARDMAWRVILECGIDALPVKPSDICRHYGWILSDYRNGERAIEALGLSWLTGRTDGFCTVTEHYTYIFYDSTLPGGRQRFTAAHEIGHLLLGHVGPGMATVQNREPTGTEGEAERQANQFAARLLAPACVLHEIGAVTAEEIRQVCGISLQASEFRAERMKELEVRQKYYTHPLERRVGCQFASYIASVRGR